MPSGPTYSTALVDIQGLEQPLRVLFRTPLIFQRNIALGKSMQNTSAPKPITASSLGFQGRCCCRQRNKLISIHMYIAGLAVGDPVYISADNTVTKALATDSTKNQVFGFVRFKGTIGAASVPTALTCYLVNFLGMTTLSGGTAGANIYLTDTGTFSATPGTVTTVVGKFTQCHDRRTIGYS